MNLNTLESINPVDGRYYNKTAELKSFFSEKALIYYRVKTEILYFKALCKIPLPGLEDITDEKIFVIEEKLEKFSLQDAEEIKSIEKDINHDVKAVEYFVKNWLIDEGMGKYKEFVHFGLTSQDLNNTAIPMMMRDAAEQILIPEIKNVLTKLDEKSEEWEDISILARTHGQPASPTRLGKEIDVFSKRLRVQLNLLKNIPFSAKFGGATGNMNAHYVTYPRIDWHHFAKNFVENELKLNRSYPTTQIEHYDNMAAFCDNLKRINTILIDLCRDMWTYISMDYFKQKIQKGHVGSSAMPHKVNPIDFENAEGNLGLSNAVASHLSSKLPLSRLQRDLTDSTVTRNVGLPFAYTLISLKSLLKGFDKLLVNKDKIESELEDNWQVVAEAIQNILRREGFKNPYEKLKELTRTNDKITKSLIHSFVDQLDVSDEVKNEIKEITPTNYTGC